MGNRAVIASATEKEKGIGIYVHWNGGVESVEAFLAQRTAMVGHTLPL